MSPDKDRINSGACSRSGQSVLWVQRC